MISPNVTTRDMLARDGTEIRIARQVAHVELRRAERAPQRGVERLLENHGDEQLWPRLAQAAAALAIQRFDLPPHFAEERGRFDGGFVFHTGDVRVVDAAEGGVRKIEAKGHTLD